MKKHKIVTWNIGGIVANRELFFELTTDTKANHLCLQETKSKIATAEILTPEGYCVFASESLRNVDRGTAIYYQETPVNMSRGSSSTVIRDEGRFQCLEYGEYYLINAYMPNSGGNRDYLDKKIQSFRFLINCDKILNERKPVVLVGDLNVGTYYKEAVGKKARNRRGGFTNEEQNLLRELLDTGFTDAVSYQYPTEYELVSHLYDRSGTQDLAYGYRLDYILVSDRIVDRIISVDILTEYARHSSRHLPIALLIAI